MNDDKQRRRAAAGLPELPDFTGRQFTEGACRDRGRFGLALVLTLQSNHLRGPAGRPLAGLWKP